MSKSTVQKIRSRINLNLLYPQEAQQKFLVRFVRWLISYGRFIVVFVEIIVLACFAMRFKLDADLATLKEEIKERVPYLESLKSDEAIIKLTQQRISLIGSSYAASLTWQSTLEKIAQQTPKEVKLSGIGMEKSPLGTGLSFKISGQTPSNNMLALFLAGLKEESEFKDINLANISYEQGQIIFSITGATK